MRCTSYNIVAARATSIDKRHQILTQRPMKSGNLAGAAACDAGIAYLPMHQIIRSSPNQRYLTRHINADITNERKWPTSSDSTRNGMLDRIERRDKMLFTATNYVPAKRRGPQRRHTARSGWYFRSAWRTESSNDLLALNSHTTHHPFH